MMGLPRLVTRIAGLLLSAIAVHLADGRILAGGNGGGTVWLWNVADPAHLRPLGQPLTAGSGRTISMRWRSAPVGASCGRSAVKRS